jgi:hypothetical protein
MREYTAAAAILFAGLAVARADEGMWTFNNFPFAKVEQAYGVAPTQDWLDHVRLSSVRLAKGCSAAFVSPHGLVQTNHHCARACVQQISTAAHDHIADGFYAKGLKDEIKCPTIEANQLVAITDVSVRVRKATAGQENDAFSAALKTEKALIENECAGGDATLRCDVVELYHGGVFNLYQYRRYQDVRLVFAPEQSIAFFGGDPDNFEFPRYDFDVSYLRVYVDDAPLDTKSNYLRYARADVAPGDLVFTSGHPESTSRLDTVKQLELTRDIRLPQAIALDSEWRGVVTQFATKGAEQARIAQSALFRVENDLKAEKGEFSALVDGAVLAARKQAEQELRAKVDADPELARQFGGAWDGIAKAVERQRLIRERYDFGETGQGLAGTLFGHARTLVRHAAEARKPDQERLAEFSAARFPGTRQDLLSKAPIYPEFEKLELAFSLTKMREVLGPDDAFVKKVLGKKSPVALAAELVDGTSLADPAVRARLLAADEATIAASRDPMIALALRLDSDVRTTRKEYEDTVDAPKTRFSGQIAAALFKLYGTSTYPDATFTLRISYGTVKGYRIEARDIAPITTIAGLYDRATGYAPFRLPESWIKARPSLDPNQPFNFASTNDVVGGNSGSPIINPAGEVVGLIFDGNIQSLGGNFGYDGAVSRAVSVNVGLLRMGLDKVYHAERIVKELAQ